MAHKGQRAREYVALGQLATLSQQGCLIAEEFHRYVLTVEMREFPGLGKLLNWEWF